MAILVVIGPEVAFHIWFGFAYIVSVLLRFVLGSLRVCSAPLERERTGKLNVRRQISREGARSRKDTNKLPGKAKPQQFKTAPKKNTQKQNNAKHRTGAKLTRMPHTIPIQVIPRVVLLFALHADLVPRLPLRALSRLSPISPVTRDEQLVARALKRRGIASADFAQHGLHAVEIRRVNGLEESCLIRGG
jgi:hypothetical protein